MELTFEQWLKYGQENGFCSEQFCIHHDGGPVSDTEAELDPEDYCRHAVRLGSMEDWEAQAQFILASDS